MEKGIGMVELGSVTHWLSGGTPNRSVEDYWNGDIPWISASTLQTAEVFDSDQHVTAEAVALGSKMAPVNSTLLLVRGSALHNEIRAGLVCSPVCFNQDVKALVPYKGVYPKYLTYSILGRQNELLRLVSQAGNTAGVLDTKLVQAFNIWLPEYNEQQVIATALSDVDALLESLDQLITKKRNLKQAAMQELLTGKTRLPGFDGEWKPLNMAQESTLKARIGWQGLTTAEYLKSGQYALITGTDFIDGKIDWEGCHFVEKERYDQDRYIQIQINDVLLTKDGTIGKAAFVDRLPYRATLNSGVFVIRPKNAAYVPKYLFWVLLSQIFIDFLNKLQAGSTISHLYQKDFVNFEFLAPAKIDEQIAIATILSDMDAEITTLEQRRKKTRDLKQAMMQELLTGKTRLI